MKFTRFFMAGLFFGGLVLSSCNIGGSALDRAKECDNLDVNVFFNNPTYDELSSGEEASFDDNAKAIDTKLKVWAIINSISEFNHSTQEYMNNVYTSRVVFSYKDAQYSYEGKTFNIDAKLTFDTVPEAEKDANLYTPTGGQETTVVTALNNVGYYSGDLLNVCHDVVAGSFDQDKDNAYKANSAYVQIDTLSLNTPAKSLYDSLSSPSDSKEVKDQKYNAYFASLQEGIAQYCVTQFKKYLEENSLSTKYLMVAFD